MGQRHQVYVRLPKVFFNDKNPNNRTATTIGFHHQWLYGLTAIRSLRNFLTFYKNTDAKYSIFHGENTSGGDEISILTNCYSIDFEEGYHSDVSPFTKENGGLEVLEDPRKCDNNNGITVIDLEEPQNPSFCFLSLHHLECLCSSEQDYDNLSFDHFYPIGPRQWVELHYGKDWQGSTKIDKGEIHNIQKRLAFLETFKTTSPERLKKIFPKLKEDIDAGIKAHASRASNLEKFIKEKPVKKALTKKKQPKTKK